MNEIGRYQYHTKECKGCFWSTFFFFRERGIFISSGVYNETALSASTLLIYCCFGLCALSAAAFIWATPWEYAKKANRWTIVSFRQALRPHSADTSPPTLSSQKQVSRSSSKFKRRGGVEALKYSRFQNTEGCQVCSKHKSPINFQHAPGDICASFVPPNSHCLEGSKSFSELAQNFVQHHRLDRRSPTQCLSSIASYP